MSVPTTTQASPTRGQIDDTRSGLRKSLGVPGIVFAVMGFMAPLYAASGYIPLVIGYGNGLGAPLAFLATGVVLGLFAVGFLALVRHVRRPGAFYSYIAASLGRPLGLGASGISCALYGFSVITTWSFLGLQLSPLLEGLTGLSVPWWTYAISGLVIITLVSVRGIDLSVKLLGAVVCIEVLVILVFNVLTLFRGGPDGYMTQSFTWDSFVSGSLVIAMLFTIANLVGFEGAAIYSEEARNPLKSIPRATYVIIIGTAIFYALTAWSFIVAMGDNTVEIAATDPSGVFSGAVASLLGKTISDLLVVLIITSTIASALAIQNVASRYLYSLGTDRVLPQTLGVSHPRYRSPANSLYAVAIIGIVGILIVVVSGYDAVEVFTVFGGILTFGFEVLLFLVSLSALVYFRRHRHGESVWKVLVAPLISTVLFAILIAFTLARIDLLIGEPSKLTPYLIGLVAGLFVLGFGYAIWAKRNNPDVYRRIGRAVN